MQLSYALQSLCITLLLALAAGCASDDGQKSKAAQDTRPIEERIKVGMTREEVRTTLGEPSGKSVNSDSTESWRYSDTAKAFIPFYAIGGGKFQHLIVNFDTDGKVKNWSSDKGGLY